MNELGLETTAPEIHAPTTLQHDTAMIENVPFFLIGAGRSGTTLLRLILLGHSRLHIPPESWFLEDLVRELPLKGPLTRDQVACAVELVTKHRRWVDFSIPTDSFQSEVDRLDDQTLRNIVDLIYQMQMKVTGKKRYGDKTPIYFRIVPELSALYPGAKFIHLIRDGRDVAISRIDAGWERYYEGRGFLWLEAMDYGNIQRHSAYGEQILEVRYEDLVRDLEATVRVICDFLSEPFEENMLNWQHHVAVAIPARELHLHRRIRSNVDSQNVAIWKDRLSSFECFSMEACLYDPLDRLGYELRFSGRWWRPLLRVWGKMLNRSAPLLRRVLPALQRRKLLPARMYF